MSEPDPRTLIPSDAIVALVVRKGAGWTLAKPLPRKLQPPEEIP